MRENQVRRMQGEPAAKMEAEGKVTILKHPVGGESGWEMVSVVWEVSPIEPADLFGNQPMIPGDALPERGMGRYQVTVGTADASRWAADTDSSPRVHSDPLSEGERRARRHDESGNNGRMKSLGASSLGSLTHGGLNDRTSSHPAPPGGVSPDEYAA